jgi:hypothetical protein
MPDVFRFTDRWQSSLRALFQSNDPAGQEVALAQLETRDRDLEVYLEQNVSAVSGTAAQRPNKPAPGFTYYATNTRTLSQYDGTGWTILSEPAQSWAYPFTNGTLGNGTWSGNYKRGDGWLDFEGLWTLGTTSTIPGVPLSITLPANRAETAMIGGMTLHLWDVSIGDVNIGVIGAGNAPVLLATDSNAVYLRVTNISPTVPFTWANGDHVSISGRYRMASRYS